jgi:predicted ATPase/class 3 adenylate cyclase
MRYSSALAAHLPEGDVTFLFTDLEGSTRLLERDPTGTGRALARHHELLAAAVAEQGGVVFETVGDAVYAAFARPEDAVAAALAGQRALIDEDWGAIGVLRARMAVHGGPVERRGDHYFGPALFRCARLQALGHGGQTLVSQYVAERVGDRLPPGCSLRSLGRHRLKDLSEPERVDQLWADGMPADFPPLRSLGSRPNNLPVQATTFIGRLDEMARIATVLESARLVTLLGPGGIGKTRLALQVAANAIDAYPDGVFFVPLDTMTDAGQLVRAVGSTLAIHDVPDESALDTIGHALRGQTMLLVLDNLEQVAGAGVEVAALQGAVPGLSVLATSRVPLNVRGERHWPVAALEGPPSDGPTGSEVVAAFEAVQLFVERARDARPDFRLSDRTASDVAAICRRLDGLPLAIELAAARTNVFEPADLLVRLGPGSTLLSGGGIDMPERQRTLRATIAWSWDLLSTSERAVATMLAVFVGGSTLEAIEALCAGVADVPDPLESASGLVAASLLRRATATDGSVRFTMLTTIREFATELLEVRPDVGDIHRRHAEWVTSFVERAELRGPEMPEWLERTEIEHDNIRAALEWLLRAGEGGLARRIVAGLWKFWWLRGHTVDGAQFAKATVELSRALPDEEAGADLAGALNTAAVMIWETRDDASEAARYTRRAMEIYRRTGPRSALTGTMSNLATNLIDEGAYEEADHLLVECLGLARADGDDHLTTLCLANIAELAFNREDNELALRFAREAMAMSSTMDDPELRTATRITYADALHRIGDAEGACAALELALDGLATLNSPWHSVAASYVAEKLLADRGRPADGAHLMGAVEAHLQAVKSRTPPATEREIAATRAHLVELLGPEAFDSAYRAGASVTLQAAVDQARGALHAQTGGAGSATRGAR